MLIALISTSSCRGDPGRGTGNGGAAASGIITATSRINSKLSTNTIDHESTPRYNVWTNLGQHDYDTAVVQVDTNSDTAAGILSITVVGVPASAALSATGILTLTF